MWTYRLTTGLSSLIPILQMGKLEIQKSWDLAKVPQTEPGPEIKAMRFPICHTAPHQESLSNKLPPYFISLVNLDFRTMLKQGIYFFFIFLLVL